MNLEGIPDAATVLIDTNILLYARNRRSEQCRQLLRRCEQGAVNGVVTLPTLAEFSHRRMVQEAQSKGLATSNPARTLSEQPESVRQLTDYAEDVRALLDSSLLVAEFHPQDFLVALELQQQHGLLTNDSLNLAIARRHGITNLATADRNFDAVPGIVVYRPQDI